MSLKLITTEKFNDLDCNFYRNSNDEILITREQIGTALEYSNPMIAIAKIHDRHIERFELLSRLTKLESTDGKMYDTYLYTTKGVMEICRWSRQPKADLFMDFVWDAMDKLTHNESIHQNISKLETMIEMQQEQLSTITAMMTASHTQFTQLSYKPPYTPWIDQTFKKIDTLAHFKKLTRKVMMQSIYAEMEDTYNIDLDDCRIDFCEHHNIQDNKMYKLNAIDEDNRLKDAFDLIMETKLEQVRESLLFKN